MPTVLVTTDFSAASGHGLDYACMLLKDSGVQLDLLHIFSVPVTYTADGIALVAIGDAIERTEDLLDEELQRAKSSCPDIKIAARVITGSFLDMLRQETARLRPLFIVLSTSGYADLFPGDPDPLNALRSLNAPVLFVPHDAEIRPIRKMAYACNYAYVGPRTPIREIIELVEFIGAELQVIHADPNPRGTDEKQTSGQQWLEVQLGTPQPEFHWIEDSDVLHGITSFVNSHDIDCLVVVPRKYGIWESLFHQSRTKALARLNKVPVLAFHERED